jgi:rhomboid protease GluP
MDDEDLRVVYESAQRREASDRALVLSAAGIPHTLHHDRHSSALLVPAEHSIRAGDELRAYDAENPPARPVATREMRYFDALPGIAVYFIVVCLIAGLDGRGAFGFDWRYAGRVDGALIRDGEWWRTVTALTLHLDLEHLVGNLLFGCFFGWFAGRLTGPGVAWLAILVAGALANFTNALLLDPSHQAIGASTAVFAALGLTAGFVWRGKLMPQEHWGYRVGPIVGGLALLMYTGTGGENTDVGAHLLGFVYGFAGGMLLSPYAERFDCHRRQQVAGGLALVTLGVAWLLALLAP